MNKLIKIIGNFAIVFLIGVLVGNFFSNNLDNSCTIPFTDQDHYTSCSDGCSNMQLIYEDGLNITATISDFNLCVNECMEEIVNSS